MEVKPPVYTYSKRKQYKIAPASSRYIFSCMSVLSGVYLAAETFQSHLQCFRCLLRPQPKAKPYRNIFENTYPVASRRDQPRSDPSSPQLLTGRWGAMCPPPPTKAAWVIHGHLSPGTRVFVARLLRSYLDFSLLPCKRKIGQKRDWCLLVLRLFRPMESLLIPKAILSWIMLTTNVLVWDVIFWHPYNNRSTKYTSY